MRRARIASPRFEATRALEAFLDALLDRTPSGAGARFTLGALAFAGYWLVLDWTAGFPVVLPPEWTSGLPFPLDPVLDLLASLFAPQVLLHLIPVGAAVWLSLRIAGHYLADLFELESFTTAARYLSASVFGIGSQYLAIDRAGLDEFDQAHPLVRIGGPGTVTVHLGYAAIFETVEGEPRVYPPGHRQFLEGFERLRAVVDLRDQMRSLSEVRCVTRDGVELIARQVQMVFRVYSGGRPRTLQDPYPFTEESIRRLVYAQPVAESGPQPWTDALPGLLERELQELTSRLSLEEFLSLQGEAPQTEDSKGYPPAGEGYPPAGEGHPPAGEGRLPGDAMDPPSPGVFHISPRRLTEKLHADEARQRLREDGLELAWAGVGAWEIRETSEPTVAASLLTAWKETQRARRIRSPQGLDRVRARARLEAASHSLRELLDAWRASHGQSPSLRTWAWLRALLQQLLAFGMEPGLEGALPSGYQASIDYLRRITEPLSLGDSRE